MNQMLFAFLPDNLPHFAYVLFASHMQSVLGQARKKSKTFAGIFNCIIKHNLHVTPARHVSNCSARIVWHFAQGMSNGTSFVINIVIVPIKNALFVLSFQQALSTEMQRRENNVSPLGARSVSFSYQKRHGNMLFGACLCNLNSFRLVDYPAQQSDVSSSMRNKYMKKPCSYLLAKEF